MELFFMCGYLDYIITDNNALNNTQFLEIGYEWAEYKNK